MYKVLCSLSSRSIFFNDEFYYYPNKISLNFFQLSSKTIIEIKLLRELEESIFRNGTSFQGFADVYNYLNNESTRPLNRKRIAEAWFSWKLTIFLRSECLENLAAVFDHKKSELVIGQYLESIRSSKLFEWNQDHELNCIYGETCKKTSSFFS
jgi:hypothetical protein